MPETPRQTFRIDEAVWAAFQKKCGGKGFTASDVLRAFIMQVVKGDFNIDDIAPSRAKKGENLKLTEEAVLDWFNKNQNTV